MEKMVEVEKISHFRNWFEIDMNIRDLFLDHPGIFYLHPGIIRVPQRSL